MLEHQYFIQWLGTDGIASQGQGSANISLWKLGQINMLWRRCNVKLQTNYAGTSAVTVATSQYVQTFIYTINNQCTLFNVAFVGLKCTMYD